MEPVCGALRDSVHSVLQCQPSSPAYNRSQQQRECPMQPRMGAALHVKTIADHDRERMGETEAKIFFALVEREHVRLASLFNDHVDERVYGSTAAILRNLLEVPPDGV